MNTGPDQCAGVCMEAVSRLQGKEAGICEASIGRQTTAMLPHWY